MLKYHKSTKEEEKEFYEDMERYAQPTQEAIEEYNRQWLEKKLKKLNQKKKDSE